MQGGRMSVNQDKKKSQAQLEHEDNLKKHNLKGQLETKKKAKPKTGVNTNTSSYLEINRLSEIKTKPVSWLWAGFMAYGKITIIAGEPGLGKSQIALSLAATVTSGGSWPLIHEKADVGSVIIFATEDTENTVKERLLASEANIEKIHMLGKVVEKDDSGRRIKRPFNLKKDIIQLYKAVDTIRDVKLIIIDPIAEFLGGIDSHKNTEVRILLAELNEFATKNNIAIIGISHLNKMSGSNALSRINGSGAFVAVARAVFIVCKDPKKPDLRYFIQAKNNLAKDTVGLEFSIVSSVLDGGEETSYIDWGNQPINKSADELLNLPLFGKEGNSEKDRAKQFLTALLSEKDMFSSEIKEAVLNEGISWKTARAAKEDLGIIAKRESSNGRWLWGKFSHEKTGKNTSSHLEGHLDEHHEFKGLAPDAPLKHGHLGETREFKGLAPDSHLDGDEEKITEKNF